MMNLREIPAVCESFSGAVITDDSLVTNSITLHKYKGYVIITKRKPYLFIYDLSAENKTS